MFLSIMISRLLSSIITITLLFTVLAMATSDDNLQITLNQNLTEAERYVIEDKGTEMPYSGEYWDSAEVGEYTCKRCGSHLFDSNQKFVAQCGWPSFDDAVPGSVIKIPDSDGRRTEILCTRCGAHLGHVFYGEEYTEKNTRYCVNSISLDFIPQEQTTLEESNPVVTESKAYFAGGCFWGVEYYLEKLDGVKSVESGFMGGDVIDPSYHDVVAGKTGHIETVEVIYEPAKISYEELTKYFFEIHDPTQLNRQGPDVGKQYRSTIFYANESQKQVIEKLIEILKNKGFDVVTSIESVSDFYAAEAYHQNYYNNNGNLPYCHVYKKKF